MGLLVFILDTDWWVKLLYLNNQSVFVYTKTAFGVGDC